MHEVTSDLLVFKVRVRDIELTVYDSSKFREYDSDITYVLIHGHPGQISNWKYLIRYLSERYRTIAYDQRGYGESEKPEVVSLDDYLEDLKELMKQLNVSEEKAILVGHSFGGIVAQEYASRNKVAGIVLIGTVAKLKPDLIDKIVWHLPPIFWRKLFFTENPLTRRIYRDMFFSAKTPKEIFEEFIRDNKEYLETLPPKTFRYLKYLRGYDATASASKIDVPTLIIVGEEDKVTPVEHSELIHDLIKKSELVVIPEAGHLVLYEKPKELAELIIGFTEKLHT